MNLRFVMRYQPYADAFDPSVVWSPVRILQHLTDEGWRDVPEVDETHLQMPFPEGAAEEALWHELREKQRRDQ